MLHRFCEGHDEYQTITLDIGRVVGESHLALVYLLTGPDTVGSPTREGLWRIYNDTNQAIRSVILDGAGMPLLSYVPCRVDAGSSTECDSWFDPCVTRSLIGDNTLKPEANKKKTFPSFGTVGFEFYETVPEPAGTITLDYLGSQQYILIKKEDY